MDKPFFDYPRRVAQSRIENHAILACNSFVFQQIFFELKTKIGMAKTCALTSLFLIFAAEGSRQKLKANYFLVSRWM